MDVVTIAYDFITTMLACIAALVIFDMYKDRRVRAGPLVNSSVSQPSIESNHPLIQDEIHKNTEEDDELIAQVRASTTARSAAAVRELSNIAATSGDQSFEHLSSQLLMVTRDVSEALDRSDAITPAKKSEIADLLRLAPDLIARISDMDPRDMETMLTSSNFDEAAALMQTLDQLRQ